MRALGQPKVLKSAGVAALICSVVCYPRLLSAPHRVYPVWYMEAVLILGAIVLWGFVFAWHTKYTGRPVFTLRFGTVPFVTATCCGVAAAQLWRLVVDPFMRVQVPEDYPATLSQWLAMTLFSLAFTQLYVVFSPFAWLIRLFQKTQPAMLLTVLFGLVVALVKEHTAPSHFPPEWFLGLLALRLAALAFSVYLYLRGGAILVWWWVLLLQSRHLWGLVMREA